MNLVAADSSSTAANRSLPPLSGRLLAAYRISWVSLALGVVATLASLALPSAMDPLMALRLGKGAVLLVVSWMLLRRRTDDGVAALLSLALLLWTITSSFDLATGDPPMAVILADRLRFLLFALALLLFPAGCWSPGWTRHVAAASAAIFLIGVAEALGLPSRLFLPLAILCVLACMVAVLVRYRGAATAERQQVKWIAFGLVIGILLILAARGAAALGRSTFDPLLIETVFQLGIVAIAIGFLVSLLRYRLYDAEAVISRSAVYATLTLALVGTFAASEALIELTGQRLFGMAIGNVSGAVAAAFAAMLLTPLHGKITSWAEQHFQHDLVTFKTELPDLLAILSASGSIKRLASAVLPRVEEAVHATRLVLLVDGKLIGAQGIAAAPAKRLLRGWRPPQSIKLLEKDATGAFPLRLALRCPLGRIRGWLLLGPRPDGSYYGRDDLDALAEIAPSLQRAIIMVADREADERRQLRAQRSLVGALESMKSRLEALERGDNSKIRI